MLRTHRRPTRTDTLFPYMTLFRSRVACRQVERQALERVDRVPPLLALVRAQAGLEQRRRRREVERVQRAKAGRALEHQGEGEDREERTSHQVRSEEHTSELQSLMRTSYAVFCLKKQTTQIDH